MAGMTVNRISWIGLSESRVPKRKKEIVCGWKQDGVDGGTLPDAQSPRDTYARWHNVSCISYAT